MPHPDTSKRTDSAGVPQHVAIVMDGNGRWATRRQLPRSAGHREGVKAARRAVQACADLGIEVLTLFAFSSENWRRPESEVSLLMSLFLTTLRSEAARLVKNNVRLRLIGERSGFSERLRRSIEQAEADTAHCDGMNLVIAANYGGRWDIARAARQVAEAAARGEINPRDVTPEFFHTYTSLSDLPEPDLFIRTGGDRRISNFLLWQFAYTELYFSNRLWPDFDHEALVEAIGDFSGRQRRFGRTGQQVVGGMDA